MLEMQKAGTKERVSMPQNFITFRNGYLFVYSLMMGKWQVPRPSPPFALLPFAHAITPIP